VRRIGCDSIERRRFSVGWRGTQSNNDFRIQYPLAIDLSVDVTWTWEEIENEWLRGSALDEERAAVAEAFNEVDRVFGREWIEESRRYGGAPEPTYGSQPTLNIVVLGKHLALLRQADGHERLVAKLRERRPGAFAELDALAVLRSIGAGVRVECEPTITAGTRQRKPDFRIAERADATRVYVEVTQPQRSSAQMALHDAIAELTSIIEIVGGRYTVEVFFLEQPGPDSVRALRPEIEEICRRQEIGEFSLGDGLAVVYVTDAQPGMVVVDDHGHPSRARLGTAVSRVENGEPMRHLVVRVPYTDPRAAQFLATEAAQLPDTDSGLIMIQVSGAAGADRQWQPVLEQELALDIYNNVSAVCLFRTGFRPTERGETFAVGTMLVTNPDASRPLPDWITNSSALQTPFGS
jgi:hypothetical protein